MDSQSVLSTDSGKGKNWPVKVIQAQWLGQTIASICWICSMFTYGVETTGDYLQLIAASAWLFANIVSLKGSETS